MSDQTPQHYMNSEFFSQVSESIKSVFDITSRIDERVKIIMEKQSEVDRRIGQMMDHINNISSRITVLESRDEKAIKENVERTSSRVVELEKQVEIMKIHQDGSEGKWKQVVAFGVQITLAVLTAYIAFKLGLSNPTTP